jgi:hypothetical protein
MFTDGRRDNAWQVFRQYGSEAFAQVLTPQAMQAAAAAADVTLGRSALNKVTLVWLGVMSALHTTKNFADVLALTCKLLDDMANPPQAIARLSRKRTRRRKGRSKHDPRGTSVAITEEAFAQARQKLPLAFWTCLLHVLGDRFQQQRPQSVRWKRYRLLMLDGTDIALPRWKRLLAHYGAAGSGQARTPQARMLMLAFAQSRLPWRYEVVPQSCHEQTSAKRLLQGLAPDDLVLMDRGFWNYGLFWQLQQQGAYFGIRLRKGVRFRTVKRLGRDDALVEWTPAQRSKKCCTWAGTGLPKSIRLRVIRYRVPGFRPSAVVTNALEPRDISREDWVRMAAVDGRGQVLQSGLYHRRWEIETMFNEMKTYQGLEADLRSRTPLGIEYELAGHVLLYFLIRSLMVEAAGTHNAQPLQLSFKHALKELDHLWSLLVISPPSHIRKVLLPRLFERIVQHQIIIRPGRHYPRPADKYQTQKYRKRAKIKHDKT